MSHEKRRKMTCQHRRSRQCIDTSTRRLHYKSVEESTDNTNINIRKTNRRQKWDEKQFNGPFKRQMTSHTRKLGHDLEKRESESLLIAAKKITP